MMCIIEEVRSGIVFNIQRFSLHDGPGIRTTVFFKGCPLSCCWCQNPEGIKSSIDLFHYSHKCLNCGICLLNCPREAIRPGRSSVELNRKSCDLCLKCVELCPTGAFQAAGKMVTVDDLLEELLKDRLVYEESGGGVTISGGEPLLQPEFLLALLVTLKKNAIHTVVETSGYAPWSQLESIAKWTDLFLYDLKLIDEGKSITYTGASNRLVISNLKKLLLQGCKTKVRMPFVPGINTGHEHLHKVAKLLADCSVKELELLPYHSLGYTKYLNLDLEYRYTSQEKPTAAEIFAAKELFALKGINITSEVLNNDKH
jgi:pyruvate formate lyase activating enzyme